MECRKLDCYVRHVLKNRDFSILFCGQLVSTVGNNLYLIALPLYVLDVTNSNSDLAIVGFAQTLPAVVGLFAGVFVDRWNKRLTMIVSDVLRAFFATIIGILALSGAHSVFNFYLIVLLVLLLELMGKAFSPAQFSLIPIVVPKEQLVDASGLNQSGQGFAQLTGTIAGGTLMSTLGAPLLFLTNAVSYVVSIVSLLFIRLKETPPAKSVRSHLFKDWLDGIRIIWRINTLFRAVVASVLGNFVLVSLNMMLAAWVKDVIQGPPWAYGAVIGAELAGSIVGGVSMSYVNRRFVLIKMLMVYSFVNGVCLVLLGMFSNLYMDSFFMFVVGSMLAGFGGAVNTVLMKTIPSESRSRVYSTGSALSRLATPVGIAIFGYLIVHVRLSFDFLIAGLLMVICGLLYVGGKDESPTLDHVEHSS